VPQQVREALVEADGGSRGNPGPAAYGAVLKDAATGRVIAERAERIGVATNNVAEYHGLIAGLELYLEYADGADLEVRMDSKLVVEQMSGNWKIKHPAMRPLAIQAQRLAPFGTRFTWIPRERNQHADRLANLALDNPEGVVHGGSAVAEDDVEVAAAESVRRPPWEQGDPTTLVLVRHGETDETRRRTFCGRQGADPPLNDDGRAQVRATADWLAPLAEQSPVLLASPLRRTRESAAIVGERLGLSAEVDEGFLEAGFGAWEGLTYAEVLERDRETFLRWIDDPDLAPGGHGDSLASVATRMAGVRDRLLTAHPGRTVVVVTHLTPIKLLSADVLRMPLDGLFRTEISPASVTVLAWWPDGNPVVRLLNAQPSAWIHGAGFALR
jgi:probable phosphoglycerate mutase